MRYYSYEVEEHTGGRAGVGAGKASGLYANKEDAIYAMACAKSRKHGATCIRRDKQGFGRLMILGLSVAIPAEAEV